MSLRSKLVRLAHVKPELRPHLLPLLKTANETIQVWHRDSPRVYRFVETVATQVGGAVLRSGPDSSNPEYNGMGAYSVVSVPPSSERGFVRTLTHLLPKGTVFFEEG